MHGGESFPELPGLRLISEIGRGSFGRVYKAVEPDNGRHVAVKLLTTTGLDEAALRQFDRERRAAGALSAHPHIVTVHRSGFDAAGRPYLVMELAPGRTLAERVREHGPLPAAQVADIGVRLAGALATAHRIGVLHCDIKPENVLIGATGEPLLADFGISRLATAATSSLGRAGTFAYSAPEIFRGEPISAASDVFALGATLYALVAGVSPFMPDRTASQQSVMYRIVNEEPADLRGFGVPEPLAAVVEKALAKDPARRQQSAVELGEELRAAQVALGAAATGLVVSDVAIPGEEPQGTVALSWGQQTPPPGTGTAPSRPRRRPALLAAGGVMAVVAVIAAILLTTGGGDRGVGGTSELDEVSASASTTDDNSPRARRNTPTPSSSTTTTAPGPALTHRSPSSVFLGTTIDRFWSVPEGQQRVEVAVTLTNTSGTAFRWHHDELLPAGVAPSTDAVAAEPIPEVLPKDRVLRWWHELQPNGKLTVTYRVDRQAGWPESITEATLLGWEAERQTAETPRRTQILALNNLTDPLAAPGAAPKAAPSAPTTTGATSPAAPTGGGGATNQPSAPQSPVVVVTTPPPAAPTVSISGPGEICADQHSEFVGSATGAVTGTWSLPGFSFDRPGWSPGENVQVLHPNAGSVGQRFTLSLQVTSSANVAATAHHSFLVVDCSPAPTASISGPDFVCVDQQTWFTGHGANATSGTWDLPQFAITDGFWAPDQPHQWVQPNASAEGGTYTWSLTVTGPTGKTATAQRSFTVVRC